MRTIKFRGKDANGEWKEGSLIIDKYQRSDGKQFDVAFIVSGLPCMESPGDMWTAKMQRVDPATVGQFTGLLDKNGKKIFEGDILKVYYYGKSKVFGVVRFAQSRFFIDDEFMDEFMIEELRVKIPMTEMFSKYQFEVIGNCWDNSELMKGGKE